jgi:RNA-directed DNA polymerase
MKRAGYLLDRIANHENLVLAFWRAAKGRRNSGDARRFAAGLDRKCGRLAREILDGSVDVGCYRTFVIHDPKRRRIHAAAFRERVLHHAIMNVCGAHFERGAIEESHACRLGKGTGSALSSARGFARKGGFFLKLDIRAYFNSVRHDVLRTRIARLFKDRDLLGVCRVAQAPCLRIRIWPLAGRGAGGFWRVR